MTKFGIVEEGSFSNTFFLFGEGSSMQPDGKGTHGPNSVLSMIYHYLTEFRPLREKKIIAQADNCVAQNKNKFVFWFYAYLIQRGLVEEVELHFLRVGHTKFSCDLFFGLFNKKYNRNDTAVPEDLQKIGNEVSKSKALLYGQEGSTWHWFDWKTFLMLHFKEFPGWTKFQYYKLQSNNSGGVVMECRAERNDVPKLYTLTETEAFFGGQLVPTPVAPGGLTRKRSDYLLKMSEYAKNNKESLFLETIRACPIVTEETVEAQQSTDGNIGIQPAAVSAAVTGAATAPGASSSSRSKMTPEAIVGLIAYRKEVPSSYGALKVWVMTVYDIDVSVSTIGKYCRKADEEEKQNKSN